MTASPARNWRTINARFRSVCPECEQFIETGERILFDSMARKAFHFTCGEKVQEEERVGQTSLSSEPVQTIGSMMTTSVPQPHQPVAQPAPVKEVIYVTQQPPTYTRGCYCQRVRRKCGFCVAQGR